MKPKIFIGDVAGEFKTLMKLVAKVPSDRDILLLGDLNDRGRDSRSVIEWAMSEPRVDSLQSNHGDMMVDWWMKTKRYRKRIWITHNGGADTLRSYGAENVTISYTSLMYGYGEDLCTDEDLREDEENRALIPAEHIAWLRERPIFQQGDGWVATHAPINPAIPFEMAIDIHKADSLGTPFGDSVIWNTGKTRRLKDQYQIHGHRGGLALLRDKQGEYGCGIDTSGQDVLTAFLWPEKTFIQVEYVR